MTLELWNEYEKFNDTYNECDRINRLIRNFEGNGKSLSGMMIIKDGDYRKNDSKDPFSNRIVNQSSSFTEKKPKKKKFGKVKVALTLTGLAGIGYLGYKYIYKPLKTEYDELLDKIIVRSESEKPLSGKIRTMTPLERKAYDRRYGKETLVLNTSDYTIHDVDDHTKD